MSSGPASEYIVRSREPATLDVRAARRFFIRAKSQRGDDKSLTREIEQRMLQRLDFVRVEPRVILDVGCGEFPATSVLRVRYPKARFLALDEIINV